MCKVFGPVGVPFDRAELENKGFFVATIDGSEHPLSLLRECNQGPFYSSGKPHALVCGDRLIATLSGEEGLYCTETESRLRAAINIVRRNEGKEPLVSMVR